MAAVADIVALVVAGLNLAAGLIGAWCWWRGLSPRFFWVLARAGQLATSALAAVAAAALVTGYDPPRGLFWLYTLLPIATSIIAEQLRIASAQTVLDQRGLEDAQAVGRLEEAEQQRVVAAIVSRETGITAGAALVIAFLALRVLGST
jgi:hypothetical protein